MLILLPPSEGKHAPVRGKPLDLSTLSHPELMTARSTVLDELIEVSGGVDATKQLKVGKGLADVVRANTLLRTAPTAPAEQAYTGVLYEALDSASLDAAARRRMSRRLLIFSALFGVLRPTDRIPAYRLAAGVSLPAIGGVARFWRPHLQDALSAKGLVVDCRSAAYAAMWAPPAEEHLPVRVLREVDGQRSVVSHMAKQTRGYVARALCLESSTPRSAGDLVELLNSYFQANPVTTAAGEPVAVRVELSERTLDVITS